MMKTKRDPIKTLDEFMEWVKELNSQKYSYWNLSIETSQQLNLGNYLYRGLSNSEHLIEASAWRRLTNEDNENNLDKFLKINTDLIKDVRLQGHGQKNGTNLFDLEILAECQHFRAATCLIDFTYSAQVALWFACQPDFKKAPNSEKPADGKVSAVLNHPSKIEDITPDSMKENIGYFFESDENGVYPLYRWQPSQLNNRIISQHSIFLFGGDRIIIPKEECIISASKKQSILDSLKDFSYITEATLFPDFDGLVRRRSHDRPYDIPNYVFNYKELGFLAYQEGEYEDAILNCDKAIQQNPEDVQIYALRGTVKSHLEKYTEAIDDFSEAISMSPDNAFICYMRGVAKLYLNQAPEAIADFDTAIHIDPNDKDSYAWRGRAKVARKCYKEAKEDFLKAQELASPVDDELFMESIDPYLKLIDSQIASQNKNWTTERFKALVPEKLKDFYETQNKNGALYQLAVDLQNLIQEKQWQLTLSFGVKYFVFRAGSIRVFGVNLFRTPRLAVWSRQAENPFRLPEGKYEPTYYPDHKQFVYPREATVGDLSDIFQFVYDKAAEIE